MRWGDDYVKRHSLKSLRLLGSVGEPINPEAWMWYHTVIGKKRCPIVDTWWQTETGADHGDAAARASRRRSPAPARVPFFGVVPKVLDEKGNDVPQRQRRPALPREALALDAAHPLGRRRALQEAVLERAARAITSRATARASTRTATSGWSAGSTTCSMSPGHRIGTAEVESALVSHPAVAEAAVVGRPDELKGQALVCFVTLKNGVDRLAGAEGGDPRPRGEGDRLPGAARRRALRRRASRRRAAARSCAASSRRSPPAAR